MHGYAPAQSNTSLRITSWNVGVENQKLEKALEFIKTHPWDILCLQEVSVEFLHKLRRLPVTEYRISESLESIRRSGQRVRNCHSVIVTRTAAIPRVSTKCRVQFPKSSPQPWRTKLFISLLSAFRKWDGTPERQGCTFVDFPFGGRMIRVFSVHLTLMNPEDRVREFDAVCNRLLSADSINFICGDLNILSGWKMRLVNWLLGGSSKYLPWSSYNERDFMQGKFGEYGFSNPFQNALTQHIANCQLDYILVPANLKTVRGPMLSFDTNGEFYGSDHLPITLSVEKSILKGGM